MAVYQRIELCDFFGSMRIVIGSLEQGFGIKAAILPPPGQDGRCFVATFFLKNIISALLSQIGCESEIK